MNREIRKGALTFELEASGKRLQFDMQKHMDYGPEEVKDIISTIEELLINIKNIERSLLK